MEIVPGRRRTGFVVRWRQAVAERVLRPLEGLQTYSRTGRRTVQTNESIPEWAADANANGEVVEKIWPPQDGPSHP